MPGAERAGAQARRHAGDVERRQRRPAPPGRRTRAGSGIASGRVGDAAGHGSCVRSAGRRCPRSRRRTRSRSRTARWRRRRRSAAAARCLAAAAPPARRRPRPPARARPTAGRNLPPMRRPSRRTRRAAASPGRCERVLGGPVRHRDGDRDRQQHRRLREQREAILDETAAEKAGQGPAHPQLDDQGRRATTATTIAGRRPRHDRGTRPSRPPTNRRMAVPATSASGTSRRDLITWPRTETPSP